MKLTVIPVVLLAASACGGSGGTSAPASTSVTASASSPASVASVSDKSPANIRACLDLAVIKLKHEKVLQEGVTGRGYLLGSGISSSLKLLLDDAVGGDAAPPTGDIGTAARAAFEAGEGIQGSGSDSFITAKGAQALLDGMEGTLTGCRAAGVTAADLEAVSNPGE